jgi:superfamily I DNA and/or RNA helicase
MHEQIARFSSRLFYDGQLEADSGVAWHLLSHLPGVCAASLTERPLLFIDTAGADFEEELDEEKTSYLNEKEAQLLLQWLGKLLEAGVPPSGIGIISPYNAQVSRLRRLCPAAQVEISSVDGFQGREKEAILISLVRSNREGKIGFLADTRRMNVALTRARRKLIVVGDSATLCRHPFYNAFLEYSQSLHAYRTVWDDSE